MRNFMIDVWVWTKGKHSRPLKTIQFQQENFPTEEECDRYVFRDEDVQFYTQQNMEISYNNVREYQL